MLTLPRNWERLGPNCLTLKLLHRLRHSPRQLVFSRALIWGSLKLAAATHPAGRNLTVRKRSSLCWSIRGVHYRYVPTIDDGLLTDFEKWDARAAALTLIAPPDHECVLQRILQATFRERVPAVFSLGAFISVRVTFASVDTGRPTADVLSDLLHRYNECVQEMRESDLIIGGLTESGNVPG